MREKVEIPRIPEWGLPILKEGCRVYPKKLDLGYAFVVCGERGERLEPFKIEGRGKVITYVVEPGYHLIYVLRYEEEYFILALKIIEIDEKIRIYEEEGEEVWVSSGEVEIVGKFDKGKWLIEPPSFLDEAIEVAKEKTRCYKRKCPNYFLKTK